ncbi:hypothetical protein F2Q68_00034191 [Brassica cretica]|uniref:Uncharacterized protein n=2 Tax=Brassica cretica TaxID=69181 RepID=A0ABQ7EMA3_BRACR|nr:hypothetical protein F2Q68_00034191 [Brassica cretica]KAF3597460.1 hypothetical protein DY000_02021709 [Brassica cretica]
MKMETASARSSVLGSALDPAINPQVRAEQSEHLPNNEPLDSVPSTPSLQVTNRKPKSIDKLDPD